MTANELVEHIHLSPFRPFRIHLSDGKHFDVTHPDQAIITRTKIILGVGRGSKGIVDHIEHCSLLHVVHVEELNSKQTRS